MTEQDFKDAYILLLSGAAKIVPNEGIEYKDQYGYLFYISFPDVTDSSKVIVKYYLENGDIIEEYESRQLIKRIYNSIKF